MNNLFEIPIRCKKFRKNATAYQYINGTIIINGRKYIMYSLTDAIKKYRKEYPLK